MNTNKFKRLLILPIVFISTIPLISVSAQEILPAKNVEDLEYMKKSKPDSAPGQMLREEKLLDNQERKCEQMVSRIQTKIQNFSSIQTRHQGVYKGLGNKLENLISRLEDDGYTGTNIDNLKADVAKLKEFEDQIQAKYDAYLSKLEEMKTIACDETSPEQYRNKLQEGRDILASVKTDIEEIKQYFLDTIKPHLALMRQEIQEKKLHQVNNPQQDDEEETENEVEENESEESEI